MSCSVGSITGTQPTLNFYDTNGDSFSVHVNSNLWYVLNSTGVGIIYTDASGNFTTAGNIAAAGSIGAAGAIGATNSMSITGTTPRLFLTDTNGQDFSVYVDSNQWYVLNEGGGITIAVDQSGNFTAAGNVTAYSDERLKSDIKTLPAALDTVDQLRGVSFVKDGQAGVGVIAQEVQKVLPQVVQENKDGYLSVAYGNLVGVLIEAVKELRAEVNALKGK